MRAVIKGAESMERTKCQTVHKKKSVYNAKHYPIKPDYMLTKKYWNRDCGQLAMDYGSGTKGSIWTTYRVIIVFFFLDNGKANTHIFFHVYLNFLLISSYWKFSENYQNTYAVLTKLMCKK